MRYLLLHLLLLSVSAFTFTSSFDSQTSNQLFEEAKLLQTEGQKIRSIKKFEEALKKAKFERNVLVQMNCHIQLAKTKVSVINYTEAFDHYKFFRKLYGKQHAEMSEVGEKREIIETMDSKNQALRPTDEGISLVATEPLQAKLENNNFEQGNQKRQLEIQESENSRSIFFLAWGTIVLALVLFGLGYARRQKTNRLLRNKNYQIALREKEKSDRLLLNILPKKVADELKEFGKTTSSKYETATVMFTDFKGFTQFAEKKTPEELIAAIDHYFSAFDEIVERHNIEKIKTIGDAYLCVGGIRDQDEKHVSNMINAAFEIQAFVNKSHAKRKDKKVETLQMRVGIHCGPVVAGVVGSRKFAYDIWGDTVNVAAHMEQSGEVGGINVSESVYQLAKNEFAFKYRGKVEAKNKGKMKMYFVNKSD